MVVEVERKKLGKADHADDYGLHTKIVRKTADETVNDSTTLQNDDELLFAIAASEVWYVKFVIIQNSGTTPDIQFQVTAPSGATVEGCSTDTYLNAALDGEVKGAGANRIVIVHAHIINSSTAGNVTLQWAQQTQEASDTKVLADSCLIATKIA